MIFKKKENLSFDESYLQYGSRLSFKLHNVMEKSRNLDVIS